MGLVLSPGEINRRYYRTLPGFRGAFYGSLFLMERIIDQIKFWSGVLLVSALAVGSGLVAVIVYAGAIEKCLIDFFVSLH